MEVRPPENPADQDYDILRIFIEEAEEIVEDADRELSAWRERPTDIGHIRIIQRQLHTIKGGARMAGMYNFADLPHEVETLLNEVLSGKLPANDALVSFVQRCFDRMHQLLEQVNEMQPIAHQTDALEEIYRFAHGEPLAAPVETKELKAAAAPEVVAIVEQASVPVLPELVPPEPVVSLPVEPLLEEAPAALELPVESLVESFEPSEAEAEPVEAAVAEEKTPEPLASPPPVVPEPAEATPIAALAAAEPSVAAQELRREQLRVDAHVVDQMVGFAGEASIYQARLERQVSEFARQLEELKHTVGRLRTQLRRMEIETEAQMLYRFQQETGRSAEEFDPLEFDRFSQLQELSRGVMESLSDINSVQEALEDSAEEAEMLLVQQERLSNELSSQLLSLRMVRFNDIVPRLRRIVRQTAGDLGKRAELSVSGGETELDRGVLINMLPPFEHMIRNSLAHGIEKAEQRREKGKTETGRIHLDVSSQGGNIVLRVSDDGAGLDVPALKRKAVSRGFAHSEDEISDSDACQLIFESGFSTAKEISQVAGRGVGMDVVASAIRQLGGHVDLDTQAGKGTTFTILLPLTQAITNGVLVSAGEDRYAVPYKGIVGIIRVPAVQLAEEYSRDTPVVTYNGETYLLHYMGHLLWGEQNRSPDLSSGMRPVLLVQLGERRHAIHVDHQFGTVQLFIKSLGPQLGQLRGLAGATIASDGNVVLVLELAELLRAQATLRRPAGRPEAVVEAKRAGRPLVLVVDDSITIRKVTTRILERNNMDVMAAKDGVEAIGLLHEINPDLILSDIEMPRMDGFELLSAIRNDPRFATVPVVMITSRTGQKHRQKAEEMGVSGYLGKPYTEADLLAEMARHLQGRLGQAVGE